MEFEGIVIKRIPFKGDDVMVSVLSNDKIHSFLAKGVLKVFSKNSSSCNFYTKSRFQVFKGKEGNFLRVGEIIESFPNAGSNIEKLALLDFVSETTNILLDRRDSSYVYPFLEKLLNSFDKKTNYWTSTLIYFAHVLTAAGYGMDVDQCVECGKKTDICAVSYKNGGFICKDCFDATFDEKKSPRKLKILRYIFKVGIDDFDRVEFEKEECKELMFDLANFLNWASQIELKSLILLKSI